ncbi:MULTISPECIES: hypothetical protein [Lysinibacillus]|uniref:hypothetical protein n=1 Tax=Lysinibacillus TaxID=400634 RepID=UPI00158683C8|nr:MULTISPECIES: hypothetical protein [Lysinibacillus]
MSTSIVDELYEGVDSRSRGTQSKYARPVVNYLRESVVLTKRQFQLRRGNIDYKERM